MITIQTYSFKDWHPYIQTGKTFSSHSVLIQHEMSLQLKILSSLLINASLDADILLTNTSLDETIGICIKKLFQTPKTLVKGIPKNHFRDLLTLATKRIIFSI